MSTSPDAPITRADLEALRQAIRADLLAEEPIDAETAARIDSAFDEPGELVSHEELKRRYGIE